MFLKLYNIFIFLIAGPGNCVDSEICELRSPNDKKEVEVYFFVDTHNDFILLEGLSEVSDCMSVVS